MPLSEVWNPRSTNLRHESWQAAEASIGAQATVGHDDMDTGRGVEHPAGAPEETHCAACHLSAVEGDDMPHDNGYLRLHRFKFAVFV